MSGATQAQYSASGRPVLTLDVLEAYDPTARDGDERDFLCPLPACAAKTNPSRHRSLGANMLTGRWLCHRCGEKGTLQEYWEDRPRPLRPRAARPTPIRPATPAKPDVVESTKVGDPQHFHCQDATSQIRGNQRRQDLLVTRADGTQERDKDSKWFLPDGRPSHGDIRATELVYCPTPLREIPDGATVVIVEGPPKVAAANRLGVEYAIGLVCGAASTPCAAILDQLARFHCVLSPDNDAHGRGQALMRRVAGALLERGAAPRWLELPVDEGGDMVDYEADGGTPEDLAARIATAPPAYLIVVAALREELATPSDDSPMVAALTVELVEVKAERRALLDENAELKRLEPAKVARRLVQQYSRLDSESTAVAALPMLALATERAEAIAAGKPPNTPIPWRGDERSLALRRSENTLRKGLELLEAKGVVQRKYRELGSREKGDWRRELLIVVAEDVPTDITDALDHAWRAAHEERPPRPRLKRGGACEACQTARCAEHPEAPVQKHVCIVCTECDGAVVAAHKHQPQRPSDEGAPVVLHLVPAPPIQSERNFCGSTYLVETERKSCVPNPDADSTPRADTSSAIERAMAVWDAMKADPSVVDVSPLAGAQAQAELLQKLGELVLQPDLASRDAKSTVPLAEMPTQALHPCEEGCGRLTPWKRCPDCQQRWARGGVA